jgi:5-formyltetrahydrofolate cyclo-ligase
MSDPIPAKTDLRAQATRARGRLQKLNPLAGETAAALFPLALLPPGAVVAGYWPFRSEIDPRPLMRRLARLGAIPALPVTPAKGSDAPLSFRVWRPASPLARSAFGVHEPDAGADPVEPDLLLVPLLAFDDRGHRLGYGAGHYDRTLARLKTFKPIAAIGLAFAAQQVARLPDDPHDEVLDGVLTERGYSAYRRDI